MFGKSYILKKKVPFTELTPGTPDWQIYWAAFPEEQEAMLAWRRAREVEIEASYETDSIAVVDAQDVVIAYAPADRVHSVYPFIKHRRSHVIVLSPNREEVILLKDWSDCWVSPSNHVRAEESYFSAAERTLKQVLGLDTIFRGRLRSILYEQTPEKLNDWEATTVYEYVLPNLSQIESKGKITSVGIRDFLQAKDFSSIGSLSFRLFNQAASSGGLKWKR